MRNALVPLSETQLAPRSAPVGSATTDIQGRRRAISLIFAGVVTCGIGLYPVGKKMHADTVELQKNDVLVDNNAWHAKFVAVNNSAMGPEERVAALQKLLREWHDLRRAYATLIESDRGWAEHFDQQERNVRDAILRAQGKKPNGTPHPGREIPDRWHRPSLAQSTDLQFSVA